MNKIEIYEPSTANLSGGNITIFTDKNKVYHVELTDHTNKDVKFPCIGTYYTKNKVNNVRAGINYPKKISLPKTDRNFNKHLFKVVVNPDLDFTPARIFYEIGICEVSPAFLKMPIQFQEFILEHEKGHFFYSDELNADLCALNSFGQKGYNLSQAFFCLENILKPSAEKSKRVSNLENNIKNNQK
jgi:hypothetical protein